MQPAGDSGLAGAGLALNQHGRQSVLHSIVRRDDLLQVAFQVSEGFAEEKFLFRRDAPPVFLQAGRAFVALSPSDDQRQLGGIERFDEVIERAQPHRLNRAADGPFRGHHDDAGVRWKDAFFQQVRSASVRQIHVKQDEVEIEVGEESLCGLNGVGAGHVGIQFLQVSGDLLAKQPLVLHDQYAQAGKRDV